MRFELYNLFFSDVKNRCSNTLRTGEKEEEKTKETIQESFKKEQAEERTAKKQAVNKDKKLIRCS